MTKFIYVMDPMCSWCWAFNATVEALTAHYPEIQWHYLMGGLAPDSDSPMPETMQQSIQSIWHEINQRTGTPFNHAFWQQNTPRRSTYPACRAVISAERLKTGAGKEMSLVIQHAYYLHARNPSDKAILLALAAQLALDTQTFEVLLESDEVQSALEQQISFAHKLGAQGFPSLYLQSGDSIHPLSYGYTGVEKVVARVETVLNGGAG
jgi:putative protein-disulfide isomerase